MTIDKPCPNCRKVTEFTLQVYYKFSSWGAKWLTCQECNEQFPSRQMEVSVYP